MFTFTQYKEGEQTLELLMKKKRKFLGDGRSGGILIFIEKKYACRFFPQGKYIFSTIFDFHFRENHFRDKFQALVKNAM